jgi:murein DD-endopeptidase MepM/ murein hydrolase activator NlpD
MRPLNYLILRTEKLASAKSATFGMVRRNADGTPRPHQGVDFAAPPNTKVLAVADGVIAGINVGLTGYGYTITLKFNQNGIELFAFYAHLGRVLCKVGDAVTKGAVIAKTGSTGNANGMDTIGKGSHLHFELRTQQIVGLGLKGRIDPLKFIELDA